MSSRQLFRPALVLLTGMGFAANALSQESADLLMVELSGPANPNTSTSLLTPLAKS